MKKSATAQTIVTRRGGEGSATAFKTVAPVELLIDYIRPEINQQMATVGYWSAGRPEAVCWLTSRDIKGEYIRYRTGHSKTKTYHAVPKTGILDRYLTSCDFPPGHLFPAKGKKGKLTQRYIYRTDENGNRLKLKGSKYDRKVRTTSGFDYAVGQAVKRLMTDDDPGIDELIAQIPEIKELGRGAFFGVSAYTFRRSQAQFLFYTLEWEATEVMGVTGHKSLDAFYHYIDYHKRDLANKMKSIDRGFLSGVKEH